MIVAIAGGWHVCEANFIWRIAASRATVPSSVVVFP